MLKARPDEFARGVVVGERKIESGANVVEEPIAILPGKVTVEALDMPKTSNPPPMVSPPVLVE